MCICKSIVKPVYANLSKTEEKQNEELIIYKEEEIIADIEINETPIEISNEVLAQNVEIIGTQEERAIQENLTNENLEEEQNQWRLIIPAINLDAGIKEGTSEEILNFNIGHLETTSVFEGTVALCAHNRGYTNNYFSELKSLNSR